MNKRTAVALVGLLLLTIGCHGHDQQTSPEANKDPIGNDPLGDVKELNAAGGNFAKQMYLGDAGVLQFDISRLPGRVFYVKSGDQIDTGISVLKEAAAKPAVNVIKDGDVYHSIVDEKYAAGVGYLSFLDAQGNIEKKWEVTLKNIATSNDGDSVDAQKLLAVRQNAPPDGVRRMYVDAVVLTSCTGTYFQKHEGNAKITAMAFSLNGKLYEETNIMKKDVQILVHPIWIDEVSITKMGGHLPAPLPVTANEFLAAVKTHQTTAGAPTKTLKFGNPRMQ